MLKKNKKTKIAAVIACRLNSTRLFAKPLQIVGKNTILDLCIIQIKKSKLIDDIVLAISNSPGKEVFIKFAKDRKIKYVIGDEVDVLKRLIIGGKKVNAKIIVRASSENPFLYGKGIDKLIKKHISGDYDLSYLGGLPLGVGMQVVNLEALEKSHKEGSKRHRSEFCTMYINENPTKFKTYRLNPSKSLNRPELRLTVDTPQDLIVVRTIIEKISKNNSTTPLDKIIKFLDNNPKIKKLNSNILIKYKREDL